MVIMRLESLSVDITNSKAPSFQLFATKETNNWVSNEASMHFDAVKCGFDLYMHFSGSVSVVNELVIKKYRTTRPPNTLRQNTILSFVVFFCLIYRKFCNLHYNHDDT